MVIRAISVDTQGNVSPIVTKTYFVGKSQYADGDVLSLVADPEELFGDNGIHVTGAAYDEWYLSGSEENGPKANFLKSGDQWELEGNMELFESGESVLNQIAGLRIQGASGRWAANKRFSVYAREEYDGSDYFEYEVFGDRQTHSFYVRHGDIDTFMQSLLEGRDISLQKAHKVSVFLNGEYRYTYDMKEKNSKYYFEDVYDVDPDNVVMIKDWKIGLGSEEDKILKDELFDYVTHKDRSLPRHYEKICTMIDMQSFIDYMCANAYLCNMDMGKRTNHLLWRTRTSEGTEYGDGRWRCNIYDIDCMDWTPTDYYGVDYVWQINTFAQVMESTEQALDQHPIFEALRWNPQFQKDFTLTFMDMANTNFSRKNVEEKMRPYDYDIETWYDGFFVHRFESIVPDLAEKFALQGTLEELTLTTSAPEGGLIQLNTVTPDLSDGSWTGKYFTDFPVTVTAEPKAGYEFSGWTGAMESDQETITVDIVPGGVGLEAHFIIKKN